MSRLLVILYIFVTYDKFSPRFSHYDRSHLLKITGSKAIDWKGTKPGGSQIQSGHLVVTSGHISGIMDAMMKGNPVALRRTFPVFSTSCTSRCRKVGTAEAAEGFRVAPSQLHEQRACFGCLQRFQVLTAVIPRPTWPLKQQNTMSRWATFVSMIVNHWQ